MLKRIDPAKLLDTMSKLLAPDGGIKSVELVPRIVKLMQKYSTKLVTKCIYIHILRSSSPEILEKFLSLKGWDLLNAWFYSALKSTNYYLCGDLVKLFALCPMTAERLKQNSENNQAPKLIRQLTCDNRIEAEIRNLSLQVLQQWMRVARSSPAAAAIMEEEEEEKETFPRPYSPTTIVDDDYSEDYVPPQPKAKVKAKPREKKPPPAKKVAAAVAVKVTASKKAAKSKLVVQTDSESETEEPRKKISRVNSVSSAEETSTASGKASSKQKPVMSAEQIRMQLAADDSEVEALLDGSSESEDDIPKPRPIPANPNQKKYVLDLKGNKEKDGKVKIEKAKKEDMKMRREREKERRERAKPYSRTELRKEALESVEKDKIKAIAAQLKQENKGKSMLAGLGRIPKLPKKEPPKPPASSFDSVLGSIDSKPKVVKAPPSKNKNRDLLETLSSISKPVSRAELDKERRRKEEDGKKRREAEQDISKFKEDEEEESKKGELNEDEEAVKTEVKQEEEISAKEDNLSNKDSSSSDDDVSAGKKKKKKKIANKNFLNSESEEEMDVAEPIVAKEQVKEREVKKEEKSDDVTKEEKKKDDKSKEKRREERKERERRREKEKRREKDKKDKVLERRDSKDEKDKSRGDKDKATLSSPKQGDKRLAEEPVKIKKYKESNIFGDVLSTIMREDKTKKRRLSDIKAEKEAKEKKEKERKARKEGETKKKEEAEDKPAATSPVPETKEPENKSQEKPVVDKLKVVKGILVFARGMKSKRRVVWKEESNLVQVEYFELDAEERANVFKIKSFSELRKSESEMEKLHSASTAEVTTTSLNTSGIYLCSVLYTPYISTCNVFGCKFSSHTSLTCNISSPSCNILQILICIHIKIHLNDNNVSS